MRLASVTKLDAQNRVHIPATYMRLLNIEKCAYVRITIMSDEKRIIIYPMTDEEQALLEQTKGETK